MDILDYLKKLHDTLVEFSRELKFDKKHPYHFNLVALYGSMLELSASILALIDQRFRTGIPSIFRTLLETYVEFTNLYNNKTYGYYMEASHIKAWLKLLKEAKLGQNPYLTTITELTNLDALISGNEKLLKDLEMNGFTPLPIYTRFEKANLLNEYRSIYNLMSGDAHSNIQALLDRHLEIKDNYDFNIVYFKDENISRFHPFIYSITNFLINASINIHQELKSSKITSVLKLNNEFDSFKMK